MTVSAQPREIQGVRYEDPIEFVVAGGFKADVARKVINAYKAFYAKGKAGGEDHWLDYVTSLAHVDETTAMAIMRRYRKFYGK